MNCTHIEIFILIICRYYAIHDIQTYLNFNGIAYEHFNELDHSIPSMRVLTFKFLRIPSRIMPDKGQNVKRRT